MSIPANIKRLRELSGKLQKEVAAEVGIGISHYNKIENAQREASVELLDKLATLYGITIDRIVHPDEEKGITMPQEVTVEDKSASEQVRLIAQLEDEDKQTIFRLIDKLLTNQKFKAFFAQNIAAL